MIERKITRLEEGQRFDKYLTKSLPNANKSFLYKMLRKKNITLNGKKAQGNEKLAAGDCVQLFFARETYELFAAKKKDGQETESAKQEKQPGNPQKKNAAGWLDVLYENEDILIVNKPAGVLSQKAKKTDISLVDMIAAYLCESNEADFKESTGFSPGICNRLDRNTSGIVVAGKSVKGLQKMTEAFRERTLHKYYICIVKGRVSERSRVKAYISKNERTNQVTVLSEKQLLRLTGGRANEEETGEQGRTAGKPALNLKKWLPVETEYIPVCANETMTLLKVNLLTGRSHQIRAHLAYLGNPLAGDNKYGNALWNRIMKKKYGITEQMLHAYQLKLPQENLTVTTDIPEKFVRVLKGEGLWRHGIQEDLEALH